MRPGLREAVKGLWTWIGEGALQWEGNMEELGTVPQALCPSSDDCPSIHRAMKSLPNPQSPGGLWPSLETGLKTDHTCPCYSHFRGVLSENSILRIQKGVNYSCIH